MSHTRIKPERAAPLAPSLTTVQARFKSNAAVQDAIGRLTQTGIDRAAISLPKKGAATPSRPDHDIAAPTTDTDQRQLRTLGTGLAAAAGALATAGVVAATGAAAAPLISAAVAGGAAAGGTAEGIGHAVSSRQNSRRKEMAQTGSLIVSVSVRDERQQGRAEDALKDAGGEAVQVFLKSHTT